MEYNLNTPQDKKSKSFRNLKVWILAHQLSIDTAQLIKDFPQDEKYDLADQMRRAARSIPSNISEGYGRYHFNDKLTFYERAKTSLDELRNHFQEAFGNSYITDRVLRQFEIRINKIDYLLDRMIKKIKKARDVYLMQTEKKGLK